MPSLHPLSPLPPLIEVLLPRPFTHPFHYLLPESWQGRAEPGMRAVVPFGHELLTGVIVNTGAPPPAAARGRLRHAHQVVDDTPLLTAELLELLRQLADEYFVPWGELLNSAIPSSLLPAGERRYHLAQPAAQPAPAQPRRGRSAQQVITLLHDHPKGMSHTALAKQLAATPTGPQPARPIRLTTILKRLAASKQIAITWHIKPPVVDNKHNLYHTFSTIPSKTSINTDIISHLLKTDYRDATAKLIGIITECKHSVFVSQTKEQDPLNGRHLYRAASTAAVQSGRSALFLSPEISRVEALAGWLQGRIACPVVVLHSELTPLTLAQRWLALRTIPSPVIVIGTRSALFAPLRTPGLIIVDEEADPLYKQEERPRLHARDLALRRAEQANIPVLLTARAPSVDSYWRCREGRYHWLDNPGLDNPGSANPELPPPTTESNPQTGPGQPGQIEVIDLRTAPLADGLLSAPLINALAERMARREQSLLFVNRRGYAHSLICRDCGELVRCAGCRVGLTYYESSSAGASRLRCRRCGAQLPPPTVCPHCQGHRLGPLGTGTQRVQAALHHRWPGARILRVDRDVIIRSNGEEAPDPLEVADLIVGTQRCLHAPAPPRLSLVAVLDAELDLSHPDFRAEERQLQLLLRLQGLLRPAAGSSLVLVQSRQPDRPTLQAFATGRLELLYTEEIAQRRSLGYPPFRRLAALRLGGRQAGNRATVDQLAQAIRSCLAAQQGETAELWGPITATRPRRGGAAAWELLLKAETATALHRSLQAVSRLPLADRLITSHALEIEVDPA
jgi:primosomal protein N' (replication factor Y) (superfamily II helicase)